MAENIHLLVTSLCDRDCKYCCNKKYDIHNLQYVTDEELRNCESLYLTGGEPFKYANPGFLAEYYKDHYPNITRVIVYTNAYELWESWYGMDFTDQTFTGIDGLDISIKTDFDRKVFFDHIKPDILNLDRNPFLVFNRVYDFTRTLTDADMMGMNKRGVMYRVADLIDREWQPDFKPAEGSIFRRGN